MKAIQGFNFLFGKLFNLKSAHLNYSLNFHRRNRVIDRNYMDYIRVATLELVSNEINSNNVKGAVAELGVYKGKFAKYINQYFPNRKLYLFDTFSGFDEVDVKSELQNNFSSGKQDFSNTSAERVLQIMPAREQCIIKQGFFPSTAIGLDERFVFVSIDADLFDPIYAGLQYFYPRLNAGGYIFIHDYNNDHYKGAKEAVDQFCRENQLNKLPLPDSAGTAVIMK